MGLAGLVVVATRGRTRRVAGTHGQAPEPGVKAADQLEVSQLNTPAMLLSRLAIF
jgi:hypothetical protein